MWTVERSCHCEPVVFRAANQNLNDCQWQSYLNVAQTGVAPSGDSLRSQSVPQSLLLRGEGGSKSRMRSLSNSWAASYPACHCEPVVLRAANRNFNDCQWQSYLNVAQTGVALSKDSLRSQSVSFVPPWLPLRGSCHEVTERVNTPSPPLWGTSPIGRGELPSSARYGGHLPRGGRQGETDCHVGLSAFSQ